MHHGITLGLCSTVLLFFEETGVAGGGGEREVL